MRLTAFFKGESWTRDRKLRLTFEVNEQQQALEGLEKLEGALVLDVKKFRAGRSVNANDYFWVLCDAIAGALGTDKMSIYILLLQDAGKFVDVEVAEEDVAVLRRTYRYVDILGTDGELAKVRCYIGSSSYDSKEMSRLIDAAVNEAKSLGIDTATPDEIAAMKAAWKGRKYDY